jgi:FkbM family methyltransferase
MSIPGAIARLFDRPGGRTLLASVTTRYARHLAHADVEIRYRGLWLHRYRNEFFPDGQRFGYCRDDFARWSRETERCIRTAVDYWYHAGSPATDETVIDVGAGRGEDSIAFSRSVGPQGRVIAIEAHPLTFTMLRRFCEWNGYANVLPVHAAALDRHGTAQIEDCEQWRDNSIAERGVFTVPARTLDEICEAQAVGPVGLLKLNIEGSELAALRGAPVLLGRTRLVAVACHDFRAERGDGERFRTRAGVQRLLAAAGFEVKARKDDPRLGISDHVYGLRH